jgi:hypothetical protein
VRPAETGVRVREPYTVEIQVGQHVITAATVGESSQGVVVAVAVARCWS